MDREITKQEKQVAFRKTAIKWGVIGGCVIAVVLACILSLRKGVKRSELRLAKVETGTIETSISASGKVVPSFEQIINSPIATRIVEVYCKEGDTVKAGTPLLRLDLQTAETSLGKLHDERRVKANEVEQTRLNNKLQLSSLEMQIKVKNMAVNGLREELINERRLDSLGSGTGERVRQAEIAYKTGQLELEQLKLQLENQQAVLKATDESKALELSIYDKNVDEMARTLEDAKIKSPRSATLTYINNQIGQQVQMGERVAVISDLSRFKVDCEIPDSYGDRVAVGSAAVVKVGKTELKGHISNLTPLSKNGVISFSVMLDDDSNARLRSGLRTEVYVMCDLLEDVLCLPNSSYYIGPGEYELFVVDGGGELKKRKVKLGDSNFKYVEVKSGLKAGDEVAIGDMSDFKTAQKLKIKD